MSGEKGAAKERSGIKVIATNRRARHDYSIFEAFEAGVMLSGTEIKSIRDGKVSLQDGYARIDRGEGWLENVYIAPYDQGGKENLESRRRRKLLMHREELNRLIGKTKEKGLTLVPLRVYLKDGRAKIELGLARGKTEYDKRQSIAERDADREIAQALKRDLY